MAGKIQKLLAKAPTSLSSNYWPEVDVTGYLDAADESYYHFLIGILWWIVEIDRIDINYEVSMMFLHLALPREGNLKEVFHVFAYLKNHMNLELVPNPTVSKVDMDSFQK